MNKSKLQKRMERHHKKEQRSKILRATIKGTVKASGTFIISAALIVSPLDFSRTLAYFKTPKIESDALDFSVEHAHANISVVGESEGFNIVIKGLSPFELEDIAIDYVQLFCGNNSLVQDDRVITAKGSDLVLSFSWGDIKELFKNADGDRVGLELVGKADTKEGSFYFKGSESLYVSSELSIVERVGFEDALFNAGRQLLQSAEAGEDFHREVITLAYAAEDQNGETLDEVEWSIEDNGLGIVIDSNTGEVTIPPEVCGGSFTIGATYRNILGRVISDSYTVGIEYSFDELLGEVPVPEVEEEELILLEGAEEPEEVEKAKESEEFGEPEDTVERTESEGSGTVEDPEEAEVFEEHDEVETPAEPVKPGEAEPPSEATEGVAEEVAEPKGFNDGAAKGEGSAGESEPDDYVEPDAPGDVSVVPSPDEDVQKDGAKGLNAGSEEKASSLADDAYMLDNGSSSDKDKSDAEPLVDSDPILTSLKMMTEVKCYKRLDSAVIE